MNEQRNKWMNEWRSTSSGFTWPSHPPFRLALFPLSSSHWGMAPRSHLGWIRLRKINNKHELKMQAHQISFPLALPGDKRCPPQPQSVVLLPDPLCSTWSARSRSPPLRFLDTTGRGSVSCSGLMRMETAEDAVISRKRLLTPCVDSFSKEVMFCVDSFKRSETVGANLLCPFKSLLSMLIAKSMEFRPAPRREKSGVCAAEQSPTSNAINKLQTSQYTREGAHWSSTLIKPPAKLGSVDTSSHRSWVLPDSLPICQEGG